MAKKILVVFPDERMLDVLQSVLSGLGDCEIETEETVKKSLEAIERTHPDLLLMEIAPLDLGVGREEFQVLTEIRKQYPTLMIVMLIDSEYSNVIEKAKQLGVEDYLVKFDLEEALTFLSKKLEIKEH